MYTLFSSPEGLIISSKLIAALAKFVVILNDPPLLRKCTHAAHIKLVFLSAQMHMAFFPAPSASHQEESGNLQEREPESMKCHGMKCHSLRSFDSGERALLKASANQVCTLAADTFRHSLVLFLSAGKVKEKGEERKGKRTGYSPRALSMKESSWRNPFIQVESAQCIEPQGEIIINAGNPKVVSPDMGWSERQGKSIWKDKYWNA